mmetsp:Transcript_81930/g.227165  ORF Transcript_81930/g.227165 Transcript_81930/m.227165 type:complete len:714 (+) Transcript_81930:60-2201(+)
MSARWSFESSRPSRQDLDELNERLQQELRSLNAEIRCHMDSSCETIREEVRSLADRLQSAWVAIDEARHQTVTEAKSLTNQCTLKLDEELKKALSSLEERIRREMNAFQDQLQAVCNVDIPRGTSHLTADIQALRKELHTGIAAVETKFEVLVCSQGERQDVAAKALRDELTLLCTQAREAAASEVANSEALLRRRESQWEAWTARVEAESCAQRERLEDAFRRSVRECQEASAALEQSQTAALVEVERRVAHAEQQVRAAAGLATQRLEWSVRGLLGRLQPQGVGVDSAGAGASAPHLLWATPQFEAAGLHGLRLELWQAGSGTEAAGEEDAGDCLLRLWAETGLRLAFYISVGDTWLQVQHRFEEAEPCEVRLDCFLRDKISEQDASLLLGIDVLEATLKVHEPVRSLLALDTCSSQAHGSDQQPLVFSAVAHRHVDHKTLDLLRRQVDVIRFRMVRRIEWRVEHASALQMCFPAGESLCSMKFDAVGIQGLQLVFYPCGLADAAKKGFCSLFVNCPSGTRLRCWLSIGKVRREAHASSQHPSLVGCRCFCRFDSCVNTSDDTVTLFLDLEDAQQDVREVPPPEPLGKRCASDQSDQSPLALSGGFRPLAGRSRNAPRPLTPASPTPSLHSVYEGRSVHEAAESVTKLPHAQGRIVAEDVKILPSLWMPKPKGNALAAETPRASHGSGLRPPSRGPSGPSRPSSRYEMYSK